MKVELEPRTKDSMLPAWPMVGLGLIVMAGLGWVISRLPPRWIPPCGFHLMTGHPCPTCGFTRMGLDLLKGDLPTAFRMNPFLFLMLAVLVFWVVLGAAAWLAGRWLRIVLSKREEKWLWLLLILAFLANWWYLWRAGI